MNWRADPQNVSFLMDIRLPRITMYNSESLCMLSLHDFLMPIESLQSFKSNIKMSLLQFRSIFVKIERQESSLLHVSMQCPQYQLPQTWALRFVTLTKTSAFPHRDGVYPYETVRQNKPSSLLKLFFFAMVSYYSKR